MQSLGSLEQLLQPPPAAAGEGLAHTASPTDWTRLLSLSTADWNAAMLDLQQQQAPQPAAATTATAAVAAGAAAAVGLKRKASDAL